MSLMVGHKVVVNKDIYRMKDQVRSIYAYQGETGIVVQVFKSGEDLHDPRWNAKVLIEGKIKTFRLTSLEKI